MDQEIIQVKSKIRIALVACTGTFILAICGWCYYTSLARILPNLKVGMDYHDAVGKFPQINLDGSLVEIETKYTDDSGNEVPPAVEVRRFYQKIKSRDGKIKSGLMFDENKKLLAIPQAASSTPATLVKLDLRSQTVTTNNQTQVFIIEQPIRTVTLRSDNSYQVDYMDDLDEESFFGELPKGLSALPQSKTWFSRTRRFEVVGSTDGFYKLPSNLKKVVDFISTNTPSTLKNQKITTTSCDDIK